MHELGHFLVAKWMGMPVETFSLGFGSRLVGFQWRETDVRLSILPLGGYVKLAGYNPEDPEAEDPHGFLTQPAWKRLLFYSGGIIANLLTAWVLLTVLITDQNRVTKFEERWQVAQVVKGSRADAGGLKRGDELVKVGDLNLPGPSWEKEILPYIQSRAEQTVPFRVLRNGKTLELSLTPANEGGKGKLGFGPQPVMLPLERRSLQAMDVVKGVTESSRSTVAVTGAVLAGYGKLVSGRASVKEMGGPGTIGVMAYKAAQIFKL